MKKHIWLPLSTALLMTFGVNADSSADERIRNTSISAGAMNYLESYSGSLTNAGGRAQLVRAINGTTVVSISAWGLQASSEYKSHVHVLPCSMDAGGHYMNDPDGNGDDQNEIWPIFTTDESGIGRVNVTVDYAVRPDAMSVVIHDTPDGGSKMLCANLNRSDQGSVINVGEFKPYTDGVATDDGIGGKGSVSVSTSGKTIVMAAVKGLDPAESYRSHVHNFSCDVKNGGGHYKIDTNEPETLEGNEMWLTLEPNEDGDAYFKAAFNNIARPDAQSIVIHRCEGTDCITKPRVACATLEKAGEKQTMISEGKVISPFSEGLNQYANVTGKAVLERHHNGMSKVTVRWAGLPDTGSLVDYGSHVHNLPCSVENGGGHYKLDPMEDTTIESNEMWVGFTTRHPFKVVRKNFSFTARADAQSIVLHDPDTGGRAACIDLDYQVGTLD